LAGWGQAAEPVPRTDTVAARTASVLPGVEEPPARVRPDRLGITYNPHCVEIRKRVGAFPLPDVEPDLPPEPR
jgi:hypothetical protein